MRGVKVFSGRSHPALAESICERLGSTVSKCDLGEFANGEVRVQIGASVRNEDVFIVQSGSRSINDSVMELLIMIAACKGGSAKSITAVIPYFPYSRQSKKKAHRGAITAKMLANLLEVAGVSHVITVDLHSSQMQGFFRRPVDNLYAEPLIARWIRGNVPDWRNAVVVSKNIGGTKRVTSLADALKLRFAIMQTDRDRSKPHHHSNLMDSTVFFDAVEPQNVRTQQPPMHYGQRQAIQGPRKTRKKGHEHRLGRKGHPSTGPACLQGRKPSQSRRVRLFDHTLRSHARHLRNGLTRVETAPSARRPSEYEANDDMNDEKARDVIIGRLVQGHVVDDDHPSPALSGISGLGSGYPTDRHLADSADDTNDPMTSSFVSTSSSLRPDHALGGTIDAAASSDEEEDGIQNPGLEHTVTLVGNVKDRTVFIMDDIIDRSGSWIAAAETCVKRGQAKKVYCIAIHALLGEDSLEELEQCQCIDYIVVTNTFPISMDRVRSSRKLIVIDLSNLLSEAMRRNHHGGMIANSSTCEHEADRFV